MGPRPGPYRTGDVGVLDDDGYLTITDRLSDVIIRGGLNLSAAEIEEALMRMPAVAKCAVVAAPDERLGERACGVLRMRPGQDAPDLAAVQAHLGAVGLPKQKWIEALRIVGDFPRTPSGKIRKFVIRSAAKGERALGDVAVGAMSVGRGKAEVADALERGLDDSAG